MSGRLYVVGTPIGNLGDLSPRAKEILASCDFIAAEDTRVTAKLLHHFCIATSMVSYHEHNQRESGAKILARLQAGECCALVTDAGMPAISDPGEALVHACHDAGIPVESVPGPVAFATALAISGMPAGQFIFAGFLPVAKGPRRTQIAQLQGEQRTIILYEAPHKLRATLQDLADALGDREVAIVRELTKIHEEVIRTTLSTAVARYQTDSPKGEIVLIVAGAKAPQAVTYSLAEAVEIAQQQMDVGLPPSEAAKQAAKQTKQKKGDIYRAMQQQREREKE